MSHQHEENILHPSARRNTSSEETDYLCEYLLNFSTSGDAMGSPRVPGFTGLAEFGALGSMPTLRLLTTANPDVQAWRSCPEVVDLGIRIRHTWRLLTTAYPETPIAAKQGIQAWHFCPEI
eukprot:1155066-Pelagomonas_calceolata.AAC.2